MNRDENTTSTKNVVILGAGFAGLAALKAIQKKLRKSDDVRITLIDQNNYFVFAPLLHQVALGVLHPWDIIAPLRLLNLGTNVNFIQARVEWVDLEKQAIETTSGTYSYDYLVLSLGSMANTCESTNLPPCDYAFTLKTLDDASELKNHIYSMFEKASLEQDPILRREMLTFCILGAGYTGTELAAAFSDMVYKCAAGIYRSIRQEEICICLIENRGRVIDDLPEKYSNHIIHHLQRHHVKLYLSSNITGIGNGHIEINGSQIIPTRTLIRATGVTVNPVAAELFCSHDECGRIIVDDYLSVSEYKNVYVIGDCMHYRDKVSGTVAQMRAHHAVRQAKAAGFNVGAAVKGTKRKKYAYSDAVQIISLGRSNALFRVKNIWISGLPALFVWVVAYSLLVTGVKNRFKIAIDWILSRIFGPDMTVTLPVNASVNVSTRGK